MKIQDCRLPSKLTQPADSLPPDLTSMIPRSASSAQRAKATLRISPQDSLGGSHSCRKDFNPGFHITQKTYPGASASAVCNQILTSVYFRVSSSAIPEVCRQLERRISSDGSHTSQGIREKKRSVADDREEDERYRSLQH